MRALKKVSNTLLLSKGNFEAHLFKGKDDVKTLKEIARARAIAFKTYLPEDVKEDLDEFDLDYYHIYLRDLTNNEIVGAYRLGLGHELFEKNGVEGFYLSTLFELDDQEIFLKQSIELGRSFVLPKYQRKYLCLLMLWKAVYQFFNKYEKINYLIGPVSIPCDFCDESNEMIVDYLYDNYNDSKELIPGVQNFEPKNKWSFNTLEELEDQLRLKAAYYPVLLKKYLAQNANVMGFNVDPEFGNSIDVLVCLHKADTPESTKRCLTK